MWLMRMMGVDNKKLYKLVIIELVNCNKCKKLPTMGQLPCLGELVIAGMDNIVEIGSELCKYDDDDSENNGHVLEVFFPLLTRLELRNMNRLIEWLPAPKGQKIKDAFPKLETLQLINCPKLNSIPTAFPQLKSLVIEDIQRRSWLETIITNNCLNYSTLTLLALRMVPELTRLPNELFNCSSLEKLSLQKCEHLNISRHSWNLISLKELCIDDCPRLSSPPPDIHHLTALNTLVVSRCGLLTRAPQNLGDLTSLTKLAITDCISLKEIPNLEQLTNLEEVDILDCVNLTHLPDGLQSLQRLRTMRVGGVLRDRSNQFPECTSLERLWLKGTRGMISLPQQLKCLHQLKVLRIRSFASLQNVPNWICNLKNLGILIIQECDNLKQLPSQKRMMRLNKLCCLRVENCPLLEDKFQSLDKAEWKKIQHVPHIKIKNCWIEGDRSSFFREIAQKRVGPATNIDEDNDDFQDAYDEDEPDVPAPPAPIHGKESRIPYLIYFLAFCLLSTVINNFVLYWIISNKH